MPYRLAISGLLAAGLVTATVAAHAGTIKPPARTVVIDFDGLPGADGTPFATYKEHGFRVTARKSSDWLNGQGYGDPPPFIYFDTPANTEGTGGIRVTHHGATFSFSSVDVYSSITPIPYVIRGLAKGARVFIQRDTIPNTYGAFATVTSTHPKASIDTLDITLTNPVTCCENPMGLDNITLTESQ